MKLKTYEMSEEREKALQSLTQIERQVIELRFGLVDGKCLTLEKVGRKFGVTRERIRQIQNKTLKKICLAIKSVLTDTNLPNINNQTTK